MTFIKPVSYQESTGKLRQIYDRIKGKDDYIDNILTIHGQRPHTLAGHMQLYKNVLHHTGNSLPKWLLEALGVYVSHLNQCRYCVEHHFIGFKRELKNDQTADSIRAAIEKDELDSILTAKESRLFDYAKNLTQQPAEIDKTLIKDLKKLGYSEGEILEANQVVSYFCYVNRTVLGLGVTLEGDILGLSPNDSGDEDNWSHN